MPRWSVLAAGAVLGLLAGCRADSAGAAASPPAPAPVVKARVVATYPHDATAFTQGLIFRDGYLFESTGHHGRSSIRRVRLETGEVLQERALDARYFGEGLTDWKDALVQLTWESRQGFVYDLASFDLRRTFEYTGEGWGLTHDATKLILSDGSSALRFLDPDTFTETGRVQVRDAGTPVVDLNELEMVGGEVYANVWHTDRIARIDPASGRVVGWIDLAGLLQPDEVSDPEAVLNGIAYDANGRRLFVTGKWWPKLFEIAVD